jgi:hypothetical protein
MQRTGHNRSPAQVAVERNPRGGTTGKDEASAPNEGVAISGMICHPGFNGLQPSSNNHSSAPTFGFGGKSGICVWYWE